ncbi:MAG TPA: ABC transporter permease [Candidatus Limnocylindria bacterium]|nr:ABC transporter permease [Candidatus Limnocylindria bacterium]
MRLLRQLARRKLRTTLTILGITIGIWALVVFSSMANKINALVEGGSQYFAGKVLVTDASSIGVAIGTAPMNVDVADQIAALDGVAAAVPQVQLIYDPEGGGAFGGSETIIGSVAGADQGHETFPLNPIQGRLLTADDEGSHVVVMGSDLARKENVGVGDRLEIRGVDFEVVGVLEPTLTAPDSSASMPLSAAQELFHESLPAQIQDAIGADELASQVVVYPEDGVSEADVAAAIEDEIDNVNTLTGAEFDEQVGSATAIFNAIIIGVAVISLVVGGLSVINTMAMSVAERTREIGIKRAIGGSRGRIIRELVTEAGMIGLLGGLIGLALGAVVVVIANEAGRDSGTILFDLTWGTAAFAVAFSTILGIVAGLVPAWSAARLDPVEALRYE